MNKLIFYNNNNNGDIHFSREFIKDIIRKTSFDEYYHCHKRSPKLTQDIENLKYSPLNDYCKPYISHYVVNNETYINTHLGGLYNTLLDKPMKVDLDIFYNYFQSIYYKLRISMEKKKFYIPEIDYSVFEIEKVNEYLENNIKNIKVLICNGSVFSNQSMDVNFKELIEKLAIYYPNTHFILTDKSTVIEMPNVLYTSDIIQAESDLNEISYLSLNCSVILGRASGPYSFTQVKKNVDDIDKTFIFICTNFSDGMWHEQTLCSKVWINDYDSNNIYETVKNQLKNVTNYKNLFKVISQNNEIHILPLESFPYVIRVECYNGIEHWYNHISTFTIGIRHWIVPHGNYQTGTPVRCVFFNNETNEYLFETMV